MALRMHRKQAISSLISSSFPSLSISSSFDPATTLTQSLKFAIDAPSRRSFSCLMTEPQAIIGGQLKYSFKQGTAMAGSTDGPKSNARPSSMTMATEPLGRVELMLESSLDGEANDAVVRMQQRRGFKSVLMHQRRGFSSLSRAATVKACDDVASEKVLMQQRRGFASTGAIKVAASSKFSMDQRRGFASTGTETNFDSTKKIMASSSSEEHRLSNPGLVIFDKDGTLIDFQMMWGSWTEQFAWRLEMASKQPLREALFDKLGYDYIRRRVHSGGALCCTPMRHLRTLGEDVLKESPLKYSQKEAEEMVNSIWQMPDPVSTARPLADLRLLFSTLRSMNMKIAVCTTDDHEAAENTLKALHVRNLVDIVVGGDDPIPAKPSPEQVYHICYYCGVAPHDTIMVGDTSTDMKMGQYAGCGLSVGVLDGASSIPDLALHSDVLIPSVAKLPKLAFQWGLRARFGNQPMQGFSKQEWEQKVTNAPVVKH